MTSEKPRHRWFTSASWMTAAAIVVVMILLVRPANKRQVESKDKQLRDHTLQEMRKIGDALKKMHDSQGGVPKRNRDESSP